MQRAVELRYWWVHRNMENKNKLVEWKAFIDILGIKRTDLEDDFLF